MPSAIPLCTALTPSSGSVASGLAEKGTGKDAALLASTLPGSTLLERLTEGSNINVSYSEI